MIIIIELAVLLLRRGVGYVPRPANRIRRENSYYSIRIIRYKSRKLKKFSSILYAL